MEVLECSVFIYNFLKVLMYFVLDYRLFLFIFFMILFIFNFNGNVVGKCNIIFFYYIIVVSLFLCLFVCVKSVYILFVN